MKASDLIGSRVFDSQGRSLGHCFEIEATQSGPPVSKSFGKALQVTGILIGTGAALQRLGFRRRAIRGPIGVRWLAHRMAAYRVPWGCRASIGHRELRLSCAREELDRL
jgi:hypothetical protein